MNILAANTETPTVTKIIESVVIATAITAITYLVGALSGWITEPNYLEIFAVFTSYSCTWLCTRESRWNYPIGVVTTAAYSLLFWQLEMNALALFNLYLVFSLAYGWFRWGKDEDTRKVTHISDVGYAGYATLAIGIGFLYLMIIGAPTGIGYIDLGLAIASGVAQFMLDNKKIENWWLWAAINIISIPYFLYQGLTLVAFQYMFFLINNYLGYTQWKKGIIE